MNVQNLGTAFEFKIHIDAGKEDCFYQMVEPGSSLYVAFHVLRGGDNNAGFYMNNPTGQTILPYQWKQHAEFDDGAVIQGGYYALCVDNKPASFQSKLVSLYVASFKRNEWERYIQELSDADMVANNATNMMRNVDNNINEMMRYLENSKQQYTYDSYLSESNRNYVQNWSILQCIVIMISSIVQVVFVRKLFSMNEGGKGYSRPRA
ncbi:hypothetical protein RDWZM_005127 [Blomia tropicalis]|uniref:GOLD domain-containing protein n=1 Tax=Blomia tropicalis TaxID=40697 RepID=A0A9Q0M548_BLOTA|nr:hypothetical protein RDWZM_005127 [Blomia tropicalis]